jgi:hypothetical protein
MPALALFLYHCTTKANAVKFMYQSLCNPPITSILNAINASFLRGTPHLNAKSIQKYLTPSPVTSKGRNLRAKAYGAQLQNQCIHPFLVPQATIIPSCRASFLTTLTKTMRTNPSPPSSIISMMNLSPMYFVLVPFLTKTPVSSTTTAQGKFPFMLLDGNVCFFVMYHYKTNAIFATHIPGLDSENILNAYKKNFEYLISKGYLPKINVMDNQATKAIKLYLTPHQCHLQLVEPGNHRVNAAEQAIQTFKNQFIGALGTTDVDFPIQLWDKLAPQ